jgi:hypothetical protein
VLSSQEERAWDDIQLYWEIEADEPTRTSGTSPGLENPPVAVTVAARVAIVLLLLGAVPAGLTLAVITALGWLVWRTGQPSRQKAQVSLPDPARRAS